jgi:rhodanese-related sulfurtransferase
MSAKINPLVSKILMVVLSIATLGIGALGSAIAFTGLDVFTIMAGGITANHITAAELKQGKLKPIILIDVRSPAEYAEDRIANSQLVPLDEIETGVGVERIKKLVQKSANPSQVQPTVLFYCTKGPRSVKAYQRLEKAGLKIAFLSGGITNWRETVSPEQDQAVLSAIVLPANKSKAAQLPAQIKN